MSNCAHLTRVLQACTRCKAVTRLAELARSEGQTHHQSLATSLKPEVTARFAHGVEIRVKAAKSPARKAAENSDLAHAMAGKRNHVAHLGTLNFITVNAVAMLFGPRGDAKTHLALALGIKAYNAGYRVLLAVATERIARLPNAHHVGRGERARCLAGGGPGPTLAAKDQPRLRRARAGDVLVSSSSVQSTAFLTAERTC